MIGIDVKIDKMLIPATTKLLSGHLSFSVLIGMNDPMNNLHFMKHKNDRYEGGITTTIYMQKRACM